MLKIPSSYLPVFGPYILPEFKKCFALKIRGNSEFSIVRAFTNSKVKTALYNKITILFHR